MDTLSLPFGKNAGQMDVSADEWGEAPAVSFQLPHDGRLIALEHIPSLIEWLQEFVEETAPELPTRKAAIIKATLTEGRGVTSLVYSPVGPDDDIPWRDPMARIDRTSWYASKEIESFDVLFPGLEDEA